MILYDNIVKIFKNLWDGYILKVAFLLGSSIHVILIEKTTTTRIIEN